MFQPFTPYPQYMGTQAPAPMHYPPITPLQTHAPAVPIQTQTEQPKVVVLGKVYRTSKGLERFVHDDNFFTKEEGWEKLKIKFSFF